MNNHTAPPLVLALSATDPTGGAGLQADVLTLAANACHPLGVTTAISTQDTLGVMHVKPISASLLRWQCDYLLDDLVAPLAACKIGLLASAENVETTVNVVSRLKRKHPELTVVCDPVLASGRGDDLADEPTLKTLCASLLQLVTVLTPNTLETALLAQCLDSCCDSSTSSETQAGILLAAGCKGVVLTGTHRDAPVIEHTYYGHDGARWSLTCERMAGEYHGTGCTFAAALTAKLAWGLALYPAIQAAQDYTYATIQHAFTLGRGQLIPQRMYHLETP